MSHYLSLYRKYRPEVFSELIGQEHIVRILKHQIASNTLSHAYLLCGTRGTGKTTTARILAKAVNCNASGERPCGVCENCKAISAGGFMDVIEIDAASNNGVDNIRELRESVNYPPSTGRKKVYIIDEVHMLSQGGYNALLKTLEEPPSHSMFILATTELQKIPATVLSRCQHHEFRRFPTNEIAAYLGKICEAEGFSYEPDALTLIARQSTGAMRDALSLLDQISSTGDHITLAMAQSILGVATGESVVELIDAIAERNTASGLEILHHALDNGTEPRQIAKQTVEYLRWMLNVRILRRLRRSGKP